MKAGVITWVVIVVLALLSGKAYSSGGAILGQVGMLGMGVSGAIAIVAVIEMLFRHHRGE